VYIEELPSAVRTITGVPTSITAFVGRAWKGPVGDPILIHSYSDYERVFGGLWQVSPMSYAVAHFFSNGGSVALIVRVTADATKATRAKFTLAAGTELEASSPGSWGNDLQLSVKKHDTDPKAFHLTVLDDPETKDDARKVGGSGAREEFLNVSVDDASPRYLVKVLAQQSKLVHVVDDDPAKVGGSAPAPADKVGAGTPGVDGSKLLDADILGTVSGAGIKALKKADLFNLLCLPPLTPDDDVDKATWAEAGTLCKDRRAVLLVDAPRGWDVGSAVTKVVADFNMTAKSYAALYFPRLRMADPLAENKLEDFAPCGVVAGVISRTDAERGVWKAPAGIEAALGGVFGFSVNGSPANLNDDDSGQINPVAVNALRSVPGIGAVVWGARTLDGRDVLASQWKYLPVRRLALYIEESLYRGTQWVVFEPNDEPLWSQIRLNVGAFMNGLFRQGAFQGTTPRDAYLVKCDKETTTQDDINRGVVNILVGFAPLKPAEFVVIKIQQLAGQTQA